MKEKSWLLSICMMLLLTAGWFTYQKITDDTYRGMSVIAEEHKDIPLFEGLKPMNHKYVIKDNRWNDIYNFYLQELPARGWEVEYKDTALHDGDNENDWAGFYSRWRKEGFNGELSISAHYNQAKQQTEIIFDKTPLYHSTIWIEDFPESICIYQHPSDETCSEIEDQSSIKEIASFINHAADWEKEMVSRENTSVIDFGGIDIHVFYERDKYIYFQSEKGIKRMKPEPEFFELMNLG